MKFPRRYCNGGPNGSGWCGKQAEYVASDSAGLMWFCCSDHHEDAKLIPIDEWFRQSGIPLTDLKEAERDAAELIRELEGEPI